jgi:hypothetical protein
MCTRTVSVLAHIFEAAGLATVGLALVRQQAENARPPRMLSVDFPLGRPLGRPNDPAFQHDVIRSAFALLERTDVPVLVDYPEVIADQSDQPAECPLPPRFDPDLHAAVDEAIGLRAAYDRNVAASGRTLLGRQATADGVTDLIGTFVALSEGSTLDDVGWGEWEILGAAQDVRAYYEEAAIQLADITGARQAESWFYTRTATGRLMHDVGAVLAEADAPAMITGYLVPGTQRR